MDGGLEGNFAMHFRFLLPLQRPFDRKISDTAQHCLFQHPSVEINVWQNENFYNFLWYPDGDIPASVR